MWTTRTLAACLAGALAIAACGDKHAQSDDANAAEVKATTPAGPVITGPVSFEDAKTAFDEKRYNEALRLFTAYTAEKPDNVWGYYMLGLSAWKAGDRETAVNAFTLALEKDSTHVKSHLNLSRVLIEQGRAPEALPHVVAVLAIDSTSSEGFRLLGRVKTELGDSAGAITAYKRAIVLDGRDVWSLNNLARVYMGQGRFEDALGPLARAIEIDSTVATFQSNLRIALKRSGHATPVDREGLARSFVEQVKTWQ
jgi:tetratricopeptide (TPR) repeat protein